MIVSWSLGTSLIWRFARVFGLFLKPTLSRMSPTNVIPHNASGSGNIRVVSAVSCSPWILLLVAHEVSPSCIVYLYVRGHGFLFLFYYNIFYYFHVLIFHYYFNVTSASGVQAIAIYWVQSCVSVGIFHQLKWLPDQNTFLGHDPYLVFLYKSHFALLLLIEAQKQCDEKFILLP